MNTLKFERLITKLCLNDNIFITGFIDWVEDNERFIKFIYKMSNDNTVYSCQLDIDLNSNKVKEILNYISEKFYPEFHEMIGFDNMTYDEYIESLNLSDDEEEDEEYESADSVAAGLGMMIDDNDNWVPDDRDYIPYEYPILNDELDENDESIVNYSKEYIYFVITYQGKE
jgi:hypothetical protein